MAEKEEEDQAPEILGGTGLEVVPEDEEQEEDFEESEEEESEEEDSNEEEESEEEESEEEDSEEEESEEEDSEEEDSNEDEDNNSVDPDSFVKEETDGKYSSFEELLEAANRGQEAVNEDEVFANEQIKKLNEIAKNGGDIMEVLRFQSMGISELDPNKQGDALKLQKMRMMQDEGLSEREADMLLSRTYNFDPDTEEAEDIEFNELKLKREAKKSKEWLEGKAKDLELPKVADKTEDLEAKAKEQEVIDNSIKAYKNAVTDVVKEYKEEVFSLDKENSLTFALDSDGNKAVKALMENPESLWNAFRDDSGRTDMKALRTFATAVTNFDGILKSSFNHGVSVGKEQVIKDNRNPERRNEKKSLSSGNLDILSQVREKDLKDRN